MSEPGTDTVVGGTDDDLDVDEPRRSRAVLLTTLVVALGLVGLLAVLVVADEGESTNPRVGEAAPLVRGTTIDGEVFDLDDQLGRWVVVNFFATWCPPCVAEHPELIEFSERHAEADDARLISVVFEEPVDVVRDFFDSEGGDWPVLRDDGGQIAVDFAVLSVPETFVISPDGFVVAQLLGGVTADQLDAVIAAASGA